MSAPLESDFHAQPDVDVLVVDDEPEVHDVTRLVLRNFRFADRPLEFLHARDSLTAENFLRDNPDIAVILLDVVMETDQAGLDLVRTALRIAGDAPAASVLRQIEQQLRGTPPPQPGASPTPTPKVRIKF